MLGSMVVRYLAEDCGHDITFTTRGEAPGWFPLKTPISVMKFDALEPIPDLTGYDWAINCIGVVKQLNPTPFDCYAVNSVFPWRLAAACKASGTRLIHVSSDCVFSGKAEMPYAASATMDAEDDYGKSKALGEPVGALVLRTSIIGPADGTHGLFEWFFDGKHQANGYRNHIWSGVTTLHLAFLMNKFITGEVSVPERGGLVQIASSPISKFQLLTMLNETFGHDVQITEVDAPESVNRALLPTMGYEQGIYSQLLELKKWMTANGLR